tara:strand:+ start:223 stop:825 length:603 start_codon:yes stop_codon:yes gene_type:complete
MKRLLLILILTFSFQSWTKADDIRDFEIEGMSVGGSALDFFTKKEIKNKINFYNDNGYIYNSRKFYSLTFYDNQKYKTYEAVQIIFKDKDKRYKIHSIAGIKYYQSDINDCYNQMEIIEKELDSIFNNSKKKEFVKRKHQYDETGKSTTNDVYYFLSNSDTASIHCFDWSQNEFIKIPDQLNVIFSTSEFNDFLDYEAYN